MSFMLKKFTPNARDVIRAGSLSADGPLLRAELMSNHRVSERHFVAQMLPKGGVGVEIGVFTGLFSTALLTIAQPKQMYFVDPWWLEFGDLYPDWGVYTANGRLSTRLAYRTATSRIKRHKGSGNVEVVVGYSTEFFQRLPDNHLDWVYLDSTHRYRETCEELDILRSKLKRGGIIVGDDWQDDLEHKHAGLSRAVTEAVYRSDYEMVGIWPALQWGIRNTGNATRAG